MRSIDPKQPPIHVISHRPPLPYGKDMRLDVI